jgi:hypothetical protein
VSNIAILQVRLGHSTWIKGTWEDEICFELVEWDASIVCVFLYFMINLESILTLFSKIFTFSALYQNWWPIGQKFFLALRVILLWLRSGVIYLCLHLPLPLQLPLQRQRERQRPFSLWWLPIFRRMYQAGSKICGMSSSATAAHFKFSFPEFHENVFTTCVFQ